ncbi:hypothetical protein M3G03_02140 [Aestuariimicrobium sp. p3-SID1156]|uniref:iron chaperone n=1 Tax=Aestuariimicrobium sp. p3-SID1156 TaxID=2916038 RepID=UPI00223B13F8|nr:hypothetical protein [Aestuariimicrobium sp. p3-SID1156]MCT1458353.1 hypothetical protein [Aestuariimicrobium sp. p3-SID1156]
MTEKKTAQKKTAAGKNTSAKKAAAADDTGISAEERAAMKQMVAERKRTAAGKNTEQDVLDAIAAMDDHDRPIAEGLHTLVKEIAPDLNCRTWYGFPAYGEGKEVLFFYQFAGKFNTRYGTLGFNDKARLDDGDMWPVTFALTQWNDAVEKKVTQLITRALG